MFLFKSYHIDFFSSVKEVFTCLNWIVKINTPLKRKISILLSEHLLSLKVHLLSVYVEVTLKFERYDRS